MPAMNPYEEKFNSLNELRVVLSKNVSNLWGMVFTKATDVRGLRIVRRDDGSWLCVLTAFGDDGSPIVAFGSGDSFLEGLKNLDRTLSKGDWRVDTYALQHPTE